MINTITSIVDLFSPNYFGNFCFTVHTMSCFFNGSSIVAVLRHLRLFFISRIAEFKIAVKYVAKSLKAM